MSQKMKQETLRQRNTIAEIAAKAGVSIPTVSRVLNNRPDVAQATREKVERIIKESGFVRSRAASVLRNGSSGIVDLVLPDIDNIYCLEIIRGVEEVLERTGLRMALTTTHHETQGERRWLAKVADKATDGAILLLTEGHSSRLDTLQHLKIPFVVIDHLGELGPDVPSVGATNWAGGRAATEHLLSLGHRRIAVIGGPVKFQCSVDRIAGYRSALEQAGVPFDPSLVRIGSFKQQAGYEQTQALLSLPHPPTAIFAGSDLQAVGAYSALRARGVAVPEEVSVIGFDDIMIAPMISPALTTVRQPLTEMGRIATTMLLRLIDGEPLDSIRVELPTTLVVRESCTSPTLTL